MLSRNLALEETLYYVTCSGHFVIKDQSHKTRFLLILIGGWQFFLRVYFPNAGRLKTCSSFVLALELLTTPKPFTLTKYVDGRDRLD